MRDPKRISEEMRYWRDDPDHQVGVWPQLGQESVAVAVEKMTEWANAMDALESKLRNCQAKLERERRG